MKAAKPTAGAANATLNEEPLEPVLGAAPERIDAVVFGRKLMRWYGEHARVLPWRGISDPYATWLSEIMLQQTRVATVIERYVEFLARFPTLEALASSSEADVLALWSGLGYYRRARMLRSAAQFVVRELGGRFPETSTELQTLPGIGDYTSAAIASIAFGESVAVVDGNVERVLLRLVGQPEDKSTAGRTRMTRLAQTLVPPALKRRAARAADSPANPMNNPAGDHNQAMMELGATICLPRSPLCLQCPVVDLCHTRGEHARGVREKPRVRRVAHLLALRTQGGRIEVLLEQRAPEASLMAGMFELPPLPLEAITAAVPMPVPLLRVRHAITNTNYQVEVYGDDTGLRKDIPASEDDLHWTGASHLKMMPLTGLARKCLIKIGVLELD